MHNHICIHSLFPPHTNPWDILLLLLPPPAAPTTKDKSYSAPRGKDLSCLDKAHPRPGQGSCSPRLVKLFASPGQLRRTRLLRRSCLIFCSCVICEGEKGEGGEGGGGLSKEQPGRSRGGAGGRQAATSDWQLAAQKNPEKRWWVASTTLSSCLPPCLPTGCQN